MVKFCSQSLTSVLLVIFGLMFTSTLQADDAVFEDLAATVGREAANKNLPLLSIVLVDEDGIVWSHGVGADAANPDLVADGNTTYRIGSVSKLFTDIVVMQMVEQDVLDLDAPVSRYLSDFAPDNPYTTPITLRSLMSHSSGLVREPPVGNYFETSEPTLAATVESLNGTSLVYEPGSKVQYSNAGIAVVGRVLEVVSGRPFAELLENEALLPLGMTHSAFLPAQSVLNTLPEAYMWSYQGDRTIAPTFELGMSPAGSMYSTMNDLALFMGALIKKGEGRDGRILQEETLDEMWTPQSAIRSGRNRSFGIGFSLGEMDGNFSVSHGGAIYGFATQLKVLPERGVGVAISTNLDMANGAVNRIADHALNVLLASKDGREIPELAISTPVPDEQVRRMVGTYENGDESIRVTHRFDDLYVERIGGLSLRLRSIDDHIVIDDIMSFNDNVEFDDDGLRINETNYRSVADRKPAAQNDNWNVLIGEYGFDHNVLYISEKFGKLHALIEWGTEYPLIELDENRFRFPAYGLYPNEVLTFARSESGKVVNASLNGIEFARRAVGDIDGDVFQISPVRAVSVLEREALRASPERESGEFKPADLVDVTQYSDTIKLDIRYASDQNFLGTPVYSSARAFLQRPAAESLGRISARLAPQGYGLLVHDAYRPWYVTKIFWDATPEESKRFVADPAQGSRHNRGCAIDLTLYDLETGEVIDMVGLYDEMSPRSYPHYPGGTSQQRWHRQILKEAMEADGFTVYEYEWWHFDFDGWENYRILTDTFEALGNE
jgi:CubicO group peptidase (beta-lactamase class C family)/D-alanyl-D-alanine dipeptidase